LNARVILFKPVPEKFGQIWAKSFFEVLAKSILAPEPGSTFF
jgi:hypothetical protein